MSKQCMYPGCSNPRWLGPKGTNSQLTLCEEHQRQYWRDSKNKKPKVSKGVILEDGTQRKVGRPRVGAPKPIGEKISPEALLVVHSPDDQPQTQFIKVIVINRSADKAQLIQVPVLSEMQWSEVRRPDDLLKLLRGTGHVIVYTDRFQST